MGVEYKCHVVHGIHSKDIYTEKKVNVEITKYDENTGAPYKKMVEHIEYYLCGSLVDPCIVDDLGDRIRSCRFLANIGILYGYEYSDFIIGQKEKVPMFEFTQIRPFCFYDSGLMSQLISIFTPYFSSGFDVDELKAVMKSYVCFTCD